MWGWQQLSLSVLCTHGGWWSGGEWENGGLRRRLCCDCCCCHCCCCSCGRQAWRCCIPPHRRRSTPVCTAPSSPAVHIAHPRPHSPPQCSPHSFFRSRRGWRQLGWARHSTSSPSTLACSSPRFPSQQRHRCQHLHTRMVSVCHAVPRAASILQQGQWCLCLSACLLAQPSSRGSSQWQTVRIGLWCGSAARSGHRQQLHGWDCQQHPAQGRGG